VTEPLVELTGRADDRYATLRRIPWWDQERLRRARVVVAGAGALGNEVLKNLGLLGVGHVLVVDHDVVEPANLTRSVFYRRADAGRRKAEVAAERLRELNPDVSAVGLHADITRELGTGLIRSADLVLGCLDNRGARLAVNRACWRTARPWIDGGLDVLFGMVRTFAPPDSACYECTLTDRDFEELYLRYGCPGLPDGAESGAAAPTTPTTASVVAALQVQEAVKLLHGLPTQPGAAIWFDGEGHHLGLLRFTRREECFAHETFESVRELEEGVDGLTVGGLLEKAGEPGASLLLDREVVQAWWCPACQKREAAYVPYDDAMIAGGACPACGGARAPGVTARLNAGPHLADVPLRRLGIPPCHIVRVEAEQRTLYFELSGDRKLLLTGWEDGEGKP
jgi:adenylyltransferase/sulfurtransferase